MSAMASRDQEGCYLASDKKVILDCSFRLDRCIAAERSDGVKDAFIRPGRSCRLDKTQSSTWRPLNGVIESIYSSIKNRVTRVSSSANRYPDRIIRLSAIRLALTT